MRRRDTTWGGGGLALWLRALILCALVALGVPALAAAADEAPGSQAVLEETAPPSEEAPPAEPVPPSEDSGAVDDEPGAEPAPTPVEGGEVPEVPTAESLIPERPLTPSIGELEPELVAPDAPSVKPSVLVMKETPPPAAPPAAPPASGPPTALPGAPLFGVVPTTPDAPGGVARTGPAEGGAAPGRAVVPDRGPLTGVLASAARGALEPAAPAAPSRPATDADLAGLSPAEEDSPFAPRLAAPSGPAPAGSSLLAVLASYVLPGGGPVPASTTLLLLIQLAVILAALVAGPRPWRTDALVPTGLLSARAGCKLAVSRPG